MSRERVLASIVAATILLFTFSWCKPSSPDPRENSSATKDWFFIDKVHQEPVYDMIIVGDSRALRGVSPEAMETVLKGTRIFNFAFHAGGLNTQIYDAAEALLASDAGQKSILLAPTALAFLPSKKANAQYNEYRLKSRDVVWEYRHFRGLAEWLQPIAPGLILQKILGEKPAVLLQQEFHRDGWIATDQKPRDNIHDLTRPRMRAMGHHVDMELVAELLNRVRRWRDNGIVVYAFSPPAYPPRVAMEDSVLGFDEQRFATDFEQSGGHWLPVEREGYESYDGSHLVESSAVALSRRLAQLINRDK